MLGKSFAWWSLFVAGANATLRYQGCDNDYLNRSLSLIEALAQFVYHGRYSNSLRFLPEPAAFKET
jgi:hypothetical protein